MDSECAFCGRSDVPVMRRIFCRDCHREHRVCAGCVEDVVTAEPESADRYHLVA